MQQTAEGRRCGSGDGSLCALRRAEGLRVVAAVEGGVAVAGEGLRVAVVRGGDGQRGGSEEAVADGGGGAAIFIACDAGAAGVAGACHRAVEHAAFDGEAAAFRAGDEASEGGVLAEVGGECRAAAAAGDGGVAEADANDASEQFAVGVACAVDGASRAQVPDGGAADALERCGEAALVAHVEGQRVAVAIEDAAEGLEIVFVLEAARHGRHADVGGQLDVFAAVGNAVAGVCGECVPFVGIADEVGVSLRAGARRWPYRQVDSRAADTGIATAATATAGAISNRSATVTTIVIIPRTVRTAHAITKSCGTYLGLMTVGGVAFISILTALAARGIQIIVTRTFPVEAAAGTTATATAAGTTGADAAGCAAETTGTAAAAAGSTPVVSAVP